MPKYFDPADYESDLQALADAMFAVADAINSFYLSGVDSDEIRDGLEDLASAIRGEPKKRKQYLSSIEVS
jgi:hypothetical protein